MLAQPQYAREITCPFSHCLINTGNICDLHEGEFYAKNTYFCNICQENLSAEEAPSSHCMICKFDLCPSCYEKQKTIQIPCPKDHPLFKVSPEKFYGQFPELKYWCDFCNATIEKSALSAASCQICQYDLCPDCLLIVGNQVDLDVPEIQEFIPQDLPQEKSWQDKGVQVSELELGIPENNDKMLCVMCLNAQRSHFFTPCMHLCGCGKCSTDLIHKRSSCPICHSPIQSSVKIYLA